MGLMEKLERLAASGIRLLPAHEIPTHFVLERDGYAALVERTEEGFGAIGSPGLLTEEGFAALVWRGEDAWFVRKGYSEAATPEQVQALRRFAGDLGSALTVGVGNTPG